MSKITFLRLVFLFRLWLLKSRQRALSPVVYCFQFILIGLILLVFHEESSELPTVLFLVSKKFDAEVLRKVIYSIAHTN